MTSLPPSNEESTAALAVELANRFRSLPEVSPSVPYESQFAALFSHLPETAGKIASRQERDENNYQSSTLIYGEIDYRAFAQQFLKIKRRYGGLAERGGVFVDIVTVRFGGSEQLCECQRLFGCTL